MNLLSPLPDAHAAEQVATLLARPGLRVERIVSLGQASPPEFWYDQPEGEWVLVLAGAAKLRFAEEPEARLLRPGIGVRFGNLHNLVKQLQFALSVLGFGLSHEVVV